MHMRGKPLYGGFSLHFIKTVAALHFSNLNGKREEGLPVNTCAFITNKKEEFQKRETQTSMSALSQQCHADY